MREEDVSRLNLQPRFWDRFSQAVRRFRWRKRHSTISLRRLQSSSSSTAATANDVAMVTDNDIDDLEMQVVRYKPEGLDNLCESTNFTRRELQTMYRGFKQECPTGLVDEESFKDIYSHFFPQGDSGSYAHYVFGTLDHDNSGSISFEDFVQGMSVLARGSFQERLQWAFSLYDINSDGIITKEEMTDIVTAIHEMMGRYTEPLIDEAMTKEHVDKIFEKMDLNRDGVISMEEFLESCANDDNIKHGLTLFDTIF